MDLYSLSIGNIDDATEDDIFNLPLDGASLSTPDILLSIDDTNNIINSDAILNYDGKDMTIFAMDRHKQSVSNTQTKLTNRLKRIKFYG